MRFMIATACIAAGALLAMPAFATPPGGAGEAASRPIEARHVCTPSRCGCAGFRKTWCTRDCRRDRHCRCVRGSYVCTFVR